ncbi:MAG: hypothetical protein Ta2G_00530 [Termitinemataceae bacterium]|nr:MAG: hypothetical protein Ta2G_00530 [Termitinemataceae bacterium]
MKTKFYTLQNDFVFKSVFASKRDKAPLKMLLQILPGLEHEEIMEITLLDPFFRRLFAGDKIGILDIKAETKNGKQVNIDMQVEKLKGDKQRIIFYLSRLTAEQIGIGDQYFQIKPSICAMITGHVLFPESSKYVHTFVFMNEETKEIWTDLQRVVIIELPKVPKDDDKSEGWELLKCFTLKNEEELKMFAQKHQRVKPICDKVIHLNLRRELRMFAESREKYRRDMTAMKDYAWDEGHAEGYGAGHAEGHAEAKAAADEIIKTKDAALQAKDVALSAKDAALLKQAAEIAALKAQLAKK